jgi:hypothetical protein
MNQPMSGFGHFFDRPVECTFIRSRGTIHAAQLPDELKGGRADLTVGGGWAEIGQRLNVPTHLKDSLAKLMISGSMIDDLIAARMI